MKFYTRILILIKKNLFNFIFEASSHALDQNRLKNFPVDIAAITNISQDHFDYHKNIIKYREAKFKLFTKHLSSSGIAVINEKIKTVNSLKKIIKNKILTYGKKNSDIFLYLKKNFLNIKIYNKNYSIIAKDYSFIELENISCAITCCLASGIKISNILKAVKKLNNPPGRLQTINIKDNIKIIIDYAHTADALKNILISQTKKNKKPNIVFGCGGNRDKQKRTKMGFIANKYADKVYVTDDNPRNENPSKIRKAIISKCLRGRDIDGRKNAIAIAINDLIKNDILIIAGKGHETKQYLMNKTILLDDYNIVKNQLKKLYENI